MNEYVSLFSKPMHSKLKAMHTKLKTVHSVIFNFVNLMRYCHLVLMNKRKFDDDDDQ